MTPDLATAPAGLTVVGIGADGWRGLGPAGQAAVLDADVLFGSGRQLDLLPPDVTGERVGWPTPLVPALAGLLSAHEGRRRVVLASGDPTLYGIVPTIARLLPGEPAVVLPQPSSISLACARMGWAQQDVDVASVLARPVETLHPLVQPGRRLLVLAADAGSPARIAGLLRGRGFGPSPLTALSSLGAPAEQRVTACADDWPLSDWPAGCRADPLTVVAVECVAGPDAECLSRVPGLPDAAYENDGQLTKRHVRAITLSSLAPVPGELLWDVGGGAGSIAIEWMRHHPACRAVSLERDPARAARIARNAAALGVPALQVVTGAAPAALAGLPQPAAVFVGGGAGTPGLLDACRQALPAGGRLVVNVTTLESEREVLEQHAAHGGELARIEIAHAAPIGRMTGWRPAMPVLQWVWQAPPS